MNNIQISSVRSEESRFYGTTNHPELGLVTVQDTTSGLAFHAKKDGNTLVLLVKDITGPVLDRVDHPESGDPDWQKMVHETISFTVTGTRERYFDIAVRQAAEKREAERRDAQDWANENSDLVAFIAASYAVGSNPLPHLRKTVGGIWDCEKSNDGRLMVYHKQTSSFPIWEQK